MFSLESPNTVSSIFSICLTLLLALSWVEGGVFSTGIMKISLLACVHSDLLWILLMLFTAAAFAVSKLLLSFVRITLTCDRPPLPCSRSGHFCEGLDSFIFVVAFSLLILCVDLGLFAKGGNIWLIPFHTVKSAAYWGLFL